MLTDDRQDTQVLTLLRILKARYLKKPSRHVIHTFEIPKLNFEATDYIAIINWANVTITEPPLAKKFDDQVTSESIMNTQTTNNVIVSSMKQFPFHNQDIPDGMDLLKLVWSHANKYQFLTPKYITDQYEKLF